MIGRLAFSVFDPAMLVLVAGEGSVGLPLVAFAVFPVLILIGLVAFAALRSRRGGADDGRAHRNVRDGHPPR